MRQYTWTLKVAWNKYCCLSSPYLLLQLSPNKKKHGLSAWHFPVLSKWFYVPYQKFQHLANCLSLELRLSPSLFHREILRILLISVKYIQSFPFWLPPSIFSDSHPTLPAFRLTTGQAIFQVAGKWNNCPTLSLSSRKFCDVFNSASPSTRWHLLKDKYKHTHAGTASFHPAELLLDCGTCVLPLVGLLWLCLEVYFSLLDLAYPHSSFSFQIPCHSLWETFPVYPLKCGWEVWHGTHHNYTLFTNHCLPSFGRFYFPKMTPTVSAITHVFFYNATLTLPSSQVEFTSVPLECRQGLWLLWPMQYSGSDTMPILGVALKWPGGFCFLPLRCQLWRKKSDDSKTTILGDAHATWRR